MELWEAVDPTIRLDPDDFIDWGVVDRQTQNVWGDGATWWTQETEGVNYYRAVLPARHLPGRTVRLDATDVMLDGDRIRFRRQAGAAVWMFPGDDVRALLMAEMNLQGIPVWVEVDDNYTVDPPLLSSWSKTREQSKKTGVSNYETHRKIIQSGVVDGVICSTPRLAEVYSFLHRNVHVCRNSVDPADWPAGDPPHQPEGVLRIGWAGSASHGYDLADVRRALDWASRQRDVEVVLFGQLSLPIRHRNIPWTKELWKFRWGVRQIDVMLCPLRASRWADCKSDVKALEASMGGAATVVSRTEPYRPWWDGSAPGYVADTPKDFLKVVKHLVGNRDEVRETARLAREYVLAERNIHREVQRWRDVLC